MRSEEYSRRTVIRSTAGALFMCATCSQSVAALAGEQTTDSPAQVEEEDECGEFLPELEWNELDVAQTPYVVRYQDGYRDDAEMLHQIAKENYQSIQDAYPHTPTGAVTLDLYPAKHYIHPHDSSSYDHVSRSIPMVTPSEYDGRRDTSNEKLMESYYTHIVIHEYTHAPQLQALRGDGTDGSNAFASPRWFIEGFAEAITVYKTNDDLRERYHNRHDSEHMMERVANGHGYLMMMNADVWRGSSRDREKTQTGIETGRTRPCPSPRQRRRDREKTQTGIETRKPPKPRYRRNLVETGRKPRPGLKLFEFVVTVDDAEPK